MFCQVRSSPAVLSAQGRPSLIRRDSFRALGNAKSELPMLVKFLSEQAPPSPRVVNLSELCSANVGASPVANTEVGNCTPPRHSQTIQDVLVLLLPL